MPNSLEQITKNVMMTEQEQEDQLDQLFRKISSDQSLAELDYRQKYYGLALRLSQEQTGRLMRITDDGVLLAKDYYVNPDEDEKVEIEFEAYGFNSGDYADCRVQVQNIIDVHRANQLWHELQDETERTWRAAADRGYPENLTFERKLNRHGVPLCQTWVINHAGAIRPFDYFAASADGLIYRDRLAQLLPGDIIANWQHEHASAPHYFSLEIYCERVPEILQAQEHCIDISHFYRDVYHIVADTTDPLRVVEAQKALFHMLTTAQLETLAELQIDIAQQSYGHGDPIRFGSVPQIQNGWLGIVGIEQNIPTSILQYKE